jgi:hypothetical protein
MTSVPEYYKVLAQPVSKEQGLPHLKNLRISKLKATGAQEAFSVLSYPESPLENVSFQDIEIHAQSAGVIQNAQNWRFGNTVIQTADHSRVELKESREVTGLQTQGAQ